MRRRLRQTAETAISVVPRPCEGPEELALARRSREVYDGGRDHRRRPRQAEQLRRPNARCEPELAPITVRGAP
jgi:hypothetical protein